MRFSYELAEPDGSRSVSPPPSSSTPKAELQWLPLQNHPIFSTATISAASAAKTSTNLIAWDGASRLYVWDSHKKCLHWVSIRLGEPEPDSISAGFPSKVFFSARFRVHNVVFLDSCAVDVFLCANDVVMRCEPGTSGFSGRFYEVNQLTLNSNSRTKLVGMRKQYHMSVLQADVPVCFDVNKISINRNGSALLLAGQEGIRVIYLYGRASREENTIICRTVSIGSEIYFGSNTSIRILQISWHPCSDTHLGVLSSDSVFRMFDLSAKIGQPEQEYYLQPGELGISGNAAAICPVDFSFGADHLWDKFSIFILFSDGSTYIICPVVPFGSVYKWESLLEMHNDARTFGLKSANSKAVNNSNLAISWLESTFPELALPEGVGGNIFAVKAQPFVLMDASILLQGPLRKVFHGVTEDAAIQNGVCEGRAVSLLYNLVGKDSILMTAWSGGQLQLDALADEIQPVWKMGSAPRLCVDSFGQIFGAAMICELAPDNLSLLKLDHPPNDTIWLGYPPPLLRLAIVDLALPKKGGSLISMASDPLVPEKIFCLHDGGIDSIVLHFLPFTSQASGKEKPMRGPSVFSVLSTCPGESSSPEPLHGFLTLSDSSGGSWIVGLTSSHECVVFYMETWNELLTHAIYNEKETVSQQEASDADTPTLISKELLSGPKVALLPSTTPNLRSVAADSIEGRSTLHQYSKLFCENYVEYAHKVHFELQHHVPHLKKIIDNQQSRLSEVQHKLLDVEKKQEKMEDRICCAVKLHGSLEMRLQDLRSLPGLQKKPLSKAERDFKLELDKFTDVELDALHSSIESLNARLTRHIHSQRIDSSNQQKQIAGRRVSRIQENELSQLKSSLDKLSLINSENDKKVLATPYVGEKMKEKLGFFEFGDGRRRGGRLGSLRIKDNKDEDLALFREMQKQDKDKNNLLFQNSDELDASMEMVSGGSPLFNIPSAAPAPVRKTGSDDFLNSDNDKNDYEWLLTPPGTPLFPSLETESHKTVMSQVGAPKASPSTLKSRLANPQPESSARSNLLSRQPTSSAGLNTSTGGLRRPSSSGGPGSRPATPTGRQTLSQSRPTSIVSARPSVANVAKSTSTSASKMTSNTLKPSRSATPTSRPALTSTKPVAPPRSMTPTSRSTIRSSTPTSRSSIPASNTVSRASTPTRRPMTGSSMTNSTSISVKSLTSSASVSKSSSNSEKNLVPPRPSSPVTRPKPWNPSDMPGFSLDAPPNLRTSLSDRPPSVTRGRPGATSSRSSSIEPVSNGRIRRQSCSPARGRPPNGVIHNSGSSVPVPAVNRLRAKANDNVSPVLLGTKMVDRVINMRKLIPPKQDDKHSPRSNVSGKSASPDSAGFGRMLSKKSLDMAMRHMDIRRTIPGNLRPLTTNVPTNSMYSMRSGPSRGRTASVSDSPHATSSNASSEVSVNNNALCVDGVEPYDDVSSGKGRQSPANFLGR
ncbi:hypothetical protein F511_04930 [Dorcoceras hygrometricum]|uniref:Nuclear pore complex protein NUP88 n=1 Tax=Dorcoceras hygrometricum TaxID=472368 RepID=A0A2Z7BKZ5_9LAMI|nr:hypothetical protein F511_04930 [Dorcoceras hygrometricum]